MRKIGFALLLLFIATSSYAATIQARLIRATNEKPADAEQLKDIDADLRKNFGFKYYHQLGDEKASLYDKKKHKFNLGEGFVVFIYPKTQDSKSHEMNIEWYSGKVQLVNTTVKIPEKSSIVLKGPGVGNDWIALALTVSE